MNVAQMIKELQKMGFKVDARRRTDGGWIITKINDMSFTGASGNQYARQVLGVELSQARIEQTHFNVSKYIQGQKKKETLDEEMKRELRKVQRVWRKNKVHGRITAKKVKEHLRDSGRREAMAYLKRQSRYGQGYAYPENVRYLAEYIRGIAKGMEDTDKELAQASNKVAEFVESKEAVFREEWISDVYSYWYEVRESGFNGNVCSQAIMKTYAKIG